MSSKYFGLPDIDTAQDVYETADEPGQVLQLHHDGLRDDLAVPKQVFSDELDVSELPDRRKVGKTYGGRRRHGRHQLHPLSHRSSSSSSEGGVRETPAARLRRLKAELAQVEAEIKGSPAPATALEVTGNGASSSETSKRKSVLPPRPPVDLMAELAGVRKRMDEVEMGDLAGPSSSNQGDDWSKRIDRLQSNHPDPPNHSAEQNETIESSSEVNLSDLDKRLAELEDLVGPIDPGPDGAPPPLRATLSKLDHLLPLLTRPRYLDSVSQRLKFLVENLDNAAAASRRRDGTTASTAPTPEGQSTVTLSSAEYASLQSLFSVLPRLDPLLPVIPPVLTRLRSLASLHVQAGDVASSLKTLQEGDKKMSEEVKELLAVVESVKTGLDEAGKAVGSNWQGLEGRLRALDQRVTALSSS